MHFLMTSFCHIVGNLVYWLVCLFLFCNDIAEGCLLCFNCILVFICVSLIVCVLMFLCHGTMGWSMDVIVSFPGHAQYLAMAC